MGHFASLHVKAVAFDIRFAPDIDRNIAPLRCEAMGQQQTSGPRQAGGVRACQMLAPSAIVRGTEVEMSDNAAPPPSIMPLIAGFIPARLVDRMKTSETMTMTFFIAVLRCEKANVNGW
jgi:hypothetical protein